MIVVSYLNSIRWMAYLPEAESYSDWLQIRYRGLGHSSVDDQVDPGYWKYRYCAAQYHILQKGIAGGRVDNGPDTRTPDSWPGRGIRARVQRPRGCASCKSPAVGRE